MDESCYINESVLLNYFAGELPADRRKEVEEWIAASEDNEKMARDIFRLYRAADTLDYMNRMDASAALQQVKGRIHKHRHRISWMVWGQRIAACMALPLLATTLYLILKNPPQEYVEIRTNPGMVAEANLPDGTKVWLNSGSSLKHPVKFTGDTRTVELDGEAYFSVRKDRSKRFVVNTPFNIQTEVLGTEFNMEAYRTDSVVRTTLVSGSVRLSFLGKGDTKETFVMKPDEEFVYNTATHEARAEKSYVEIYTAWKNGQVVLKNTSLAETLKILSKRFNVEFIVKDSTLYANSFTGVFSRQYLPLILEHFRYASGIQYKYLDLEYDATHKAIQEKTKIELY